MRCRFGKARWGSLQRSDHMNKKQYFGLFLFCAIVLLFVLFFFQYRGADFKPCETTIEFERGSFCLELAETPEEKEQGLMNYRYLPESQGMLFVFDDTNPRQFWMKNTVIPLDLIYLDENFSVVDIKTLPPCESDPCEIYTSKPAMYVLEINAGLAKEENILIGNQASLRK